MPDSPRHRGFGEIQIRSLRRSVPGLARRTASGTVRKAVALGKSKPAARCSAGEGFSRGGTIWIGS